MSSIHLTLASGLVTIFTDDKGDIHLVSTKDGGEKTSEKIISIDQMYDDLLDAGLDKSDLSRKEWDDIFHPMKIKYYCTAMKLHRFIPKYLLPGDQKYLIHHLVELIYHTPKGLSLKLVLKDQKLSSISRNKTKYIHSVATSGMDFSEWGIITDKLAKCY